ncbi:hypothetical protein AX768_25250 [Burkholderia sp. PAMC 28687]|uniref:phage tail assembly chaperone n=1 Tax=Burkholderia sp. PAMC 28687 TaxID=1795874 RepID=UPI00078345DC|nr:hypothetical protein [Burkholderia sp. PAMC 28687]AMM17509.1 hypothetical protein AX768_25250 [Burkholderia sp. PAMC 28687]
MIEFEIGGIEYRSGKLDTFKQLHVSRKIGPLVPKLLPAFASIAAKKEGKNDIALIAGALQPVADVMAEMSEADVEYIFSNCLAVVQRKQGKDWARVWNNGALMFDDIEMPMMIQITMKVIWDNLGAFIQGLLAKQAAGSPPAPV